jgi:L-ascorbate metabolism protein UlaG (beta-lactamase superfamily)
MGHACFRLKGRDTVVLMDPFHEDLGISLGRPRADIVTISHDHPGHNNWEAVRNDPKVLSGPGEYEIKGVFVTGISTFHDQQRGALYGRNVAYLVEMEDLAICHLGDLGHTLGDQELEALGKVDVLLIPVGGVTTLNAAGAAEVINQVEPKIVIPMHFRMGTIRTDLEPLDDFCRVMGLKEPELRDKLSLKATDLPEDTQVVLLKVNP